MTGSRSVAVALALPFTVLAIVLTAGCGSGGTTTVDQQDSVSFAQRALASKFPHLPKAQSVDCPSDVEAKEGTTFDCTATLENGQQVTLPIRIGALSEGQASVELSPDV